MLAYFHFHLSKFVLCWLISNASILSVCVSSFFPPKAKDVHSNNKREEKYEKISLIKGISCHTRRLIFLSCWTAMPLLSVLAARLLQSSLPCVSPCLACMSFDYDLSPFNITQTRLCHVPSAVWPIHSVMERVDSCSVTTLSLQGGISGQDIQPTSLLSCIVKKEQQILERKILTFKDKAVQGWMSFLFTLPQNLNIWLAPAVPQSAG